VKIKRNAVESATNMNLTNIQINNNSISFQRNACNVHITYYRYSLSFASFIGILYSHAEMW